MADENASSASSPNPFPTDPTTVDPGEVSRRGGPFATHLGIEFDEVTTDRLTGHVDIDERHHQPYGIVHGGVYCAIVETFASVAAGVNTWKDGKLVVGVSNQTDFLRAHRLGRIDVVATPVHRGRLQHLWQVEITSAETSKVLSRGQVRLQILDTGHRLGGESTTNDSMKEQA